LPFLGQWLIVATRETIAVSMLTRASNLAVSLLQETACFTRFSRTHDRGGELEFLDRMRAEVHLSKSAVAADPGAVRAAEEARRSILGTYRKRTVKSAACFERASRVLAGGTTGNLRHFHPYPLYFKEASGSTVIDIDGNRYVDCFLGNGPLLLGHRHPRVTAAIGRCTSMGSLLVNPPLAVELAEEIQRTVPCAERMRFLNSGTEAVLTAVRLARAHTQRSKVVKFLGHYHGQDDQFLIGLDPAGSVLGNGIPAEALANTVLCRYGSIEHLVEVLDRHADVAAVVLDPAMHAGGLWGSSTVYLRAVREVTARRGIVLIFDEVISGFRLHAGGAQAFYEVTPDLATFAKALGAGEKLAAVAGREEIFRSLGPDRSGGPALVFQSGTGNDGTVALAAGAAAVSLYRELEAAGEYGALAARAERLTAGLSHAFRSHGVPCHINQLGPMLQLCLSEETPSFETFSRVPTVTLALFYLALINEGALLSLPTSNHVYLSFAHTDEDICQVLEAAVRVLDTFNFRAIVRAGDVPQ